MLEIERSKTITYRWWRSGRYEEIISEHIPALEESAEDRIAKMMTEGYTSGELRDNIHMTDDDPDDGVVYIGWWEISTPS
jgi:hypothetical protein